MFIYSVTVVLASLLVSRKYLCVRSFDTLVHTIMRVQYIVCPYIVNVILDLLYSPPNMQALVR